MKKSFQYEYTSLSSKDELDEDAKRVLNSAQEILVNAHAPYSNFKVGAAVLVAGGDIHVGVNIENASYPVGICAERSALSGLLSQFPHADIQCIAVSYINASGESKFPAYPCGMCRQYLVEVEEIVGHPIQVILAGLTGEVHVIDSTRNLLPFNFEKDQLI
jgi:cytidine deaminase